MTLWRLDCTHGPGETDGAMTIYFSDEHSARAERRRLEYFAWEVEAYTEQVDRYFALQLRLSGPWPMANVQQLCSLIDAQAAKEFVE